MTAADEKPGLCRTLRADMAALHIRHTGFAAMVAYLFIRPGFLAVFLYRLAFAVRPKGGIAGKAVAKFLWRLNVFLTSCDIDPRCMIGAGLNIPHPVGIVIGERVRIGRNVTIYQHATLGLRHAASGGIDAYPTVGDGVLISAGAVILGGVTIGGGARIGANAVVMSDVPPDTTAAGVPARVL